MTMNRVHSFIRLSFLSRLAVSQKSIEIATEAANGQKAAKAELKAALKEKKVMETKMANLAEEKSK